MLITMLIIYKFTIYRSQDAALSRLILHIRFESDIF